ncbi:MAG: glutamate-5-semialdehyde dehydrogenase [Deltaproteobacteria bacterium]|nr:glutamate-5-semialdehyde dehydrogenase [Deltaproteobacteria bacterium]
MGRSAIAEATKVAMAARRAAPDLMAAATAAKDAVLAKSAALLVDRRKAVLSANARDLKIGERQSLSPALLDRLRLTPERLDEMRAMIDAVRVLPDPVDRSLGEWTRPNGLAIAKVAVPLGVLLIIYEARPNVTVECASLAIKSGNAILLRGGSEAAHSNQALAVCFQEALRASGLPATAVGTIPPADRRAIYALLKRDDLIHLVIPRGGPSLIRAVTAKSRIPVIKHYQGICHVYVDAAADLAMAEQIVVNAKCQRPGVCNAMECLLVNAVVAPSFLPRIGDALASRGGQLYACPRSRAILGKRPYVRPATPAHYRTEYLDLRCSVRVVEDVHAAVAHIMTYGSQHTDAIVSQDPAAIAIFVKDVDSASVMVNTTTRFSDGFQYGLGAEIGISTDKIHARGPMGLDSLTSYKYVVTGQGQLRT